MSVVQILGLPGVTPVIELGTGDARVHETAAQWDVDEWDDPTTKWSGVEPYWVDVTCNSHEAETFTGRERTSEQWEVGTATVVLNNNTGWADYPQTVPSETFLAVRPGVQIRVGVRVGEAFYGLWRGFVDQANPGYDVERGDVVTLECIDAKGEVGRGDIAKVDPVVGASEYVHERLNRILDIQFWPEEWRNLEHSGIRLIAGEFGQQAIDLLNRAADSGGGSLYGDIDGKLRYRNYGWQMFSGADPVDGSIGNVQPSRYEPVPYEEAPDGTRIYLPPEGVTITEDPAGSGIYTTTGPVTQIEDPRYPGLYTFGVYIVGDACPTGWELSFARGDFANRVIVGRSDMPEPLVYDDVPDRSAFGVEPFTLTDLETELEGELTLLAARILRARNFALAPRIAAVNFNAATAPDLPQLLATADPRTPSRYLCRHRGTNGRNVFNKVMLVTGIRHTITPDLWEARISLDDASPWQIGAEEARWDVGQWDVDEWAKTPVPI